MRHCDAAMIQAIRESLGMSPIPDLASTMTDEEYAASIERKRKRDNERKLVWYYKNLEREQKKSRDRHRAAKARAHG